MLSKIRYIVIGFVVASALFVSLAVIAQSSLANIIQPTIIDIRQDVPVIAEINGETVPFTVGVALQVDISGPISTAVEAALIPTPAIEVATATPRPTGGTSLESALPLDYEEVARYSDKHVGDVYSFLATVESVSEDYAQLKVTIDGIERKAGGNAIILRTDDVARVLPDEVIDVVAIVEERLNLGTGYKPTFTALSIEIVDADE